MKLKRLLVFGTALAMIISICMTSALAVETYPDVKGHWAEEYIMNMTEAGLFNGYEDGTFRPDNTLTAAEALTLCARVASTVYGLDDSDIEIMTAKWQDQLSDLMGSSYAWFYDEAATALEAGIITYDELSSLTTSPGLGTPLSKEMFAVYLVKAMGLNTTAQSLDSYELGYGDSGDISRDHRAYIYLLTECGVLTGDENGNFDPDDPLYRAISATMLSRALDYAESAGLSPVLPNYTDKDFTAGTIEGYTVNRDGSITIELSNSVSGDKTVTVPETVNIYKNNVLAVSSSVKAGQFAWILFDGDGNAVDLYVFDASSLTTVSGTVKSASADEIILEVGLEQYVITLDEFTEVKMGTEVGGPWIIESGYEFTDATVRSFNGGSAVSVILSGGVRAEEGLITDIQSLSGGVYAITLTGFDGISARYVVNADASITVNGSAGTIRSGYVGAYALVWVSNDDGETSDAVQIDTVSEYVLGSVKSVGKNSISVTSLDSGSSSTYSVNDSTEIYYNGHESTLSSIGSSDYVTVKISGEDALMISAWPGTVETTGTLDYISYNSSSAYLGVRLSTGSVVQFCIELTDLPSITRNDSSSSLGHLVIGDTVTVTVKYQTVTNVSAYEQSANYAGIIESVTHTSSNSIIVLMLDTGSRGTYTISESAAITRDGKAISRTDLEPGWTISAVVSGGTITSIQVTDTTTATSKITGTVLYTDSSAKEILFLTDDGAAVTISVSSSTKYMDAATGGSLTINSLSTGNSLSVYGEYSSGEFKATLIVRE